MNHRAQRLTFILGLAFLTLILGTSAIAHADDRVLRLRADEFYPYNGFPNSEMPGALIELAREVFEAEGYKIEYDLAPWSRSIRDVREGRIDGLVGCGKGDAPDLVFPAVPLIRVDYSFFTTTGSAWTFTDLASLATQKVGIIQDYSYGSTLDQYVAAHGHDPKLIYATSGEQALSLLLRMLLKGRVTAILSSKAVLEEAQRREQIAGSRLRYAGRAPETDPLYIAFSPKKPDAPAWAEALAKGVLHLKKNGRYEAILRRYRLREED